MVRHAALPGVHAKAAEAAGVPIDRADYNLLRVVADLEPARISAVADRLGTTVPPVSRAIARLVSAGFAQSEMDPDDRRARRVRLTPHGVDALRALGAARHSAIRRLVTSWSDDEREEFARLLESFLAELQSRDEPNVMPTSSRPIS